MLAAFLKNTVAQLITATFLVTALLASWGADRVPAGSGAQSQEIRWTFRHALPTVGGDNLHLESYVVYQCWIWNNWCVQDLKLSRRGELDADLRIGARAPGRRSTARPAPSRPSVQALT